MIHESGTPFSTSVSTVILRDVGSVDTAIAEIDGACLFQERVYLKKFTYRRARIATVMLFWGWLASTDPKLSNANVRVLQPNLPRMYLLQ
jgi:hypothetical protein